MIFHEILNHKITAIHYPMLSEYFSRPVVIDSIGCEYRISTYWIEKEDILHAIEKDKSLYLELINGTTIKLDTI